MLLSLLLCRLRLASQYDGIAKLNGFHRYRLQAARQRIRCEAHVALPDIQRLKCVAVEPRLYQPLWIRLVRCPEESI